MDKNTIKYIKNLQQKKYRTLQGEFVIEGTKMVNELLQSDFKTKAIYTTGQEDLIKTETKVELINEKELDRISCLKSPNKTLAIAEIPKNDKVPSNLESKLSLVLESVQDPGNMGTIIRIANWYGVEHIFCSNDTVDCYNPKVVQATMGAIFRVKIHYLDIYKLVEQFNVVENFGIYVTHLNGQNIHTAEINNNGFIIMGNESKGVSEKFNQYNIQKLRLPSYPSEAKNMESLNVAVATAVTLAEFRRR